MWTTYGIKSSGEFLEDYGMIVLNNDYDDFQLELPDEFINSVVDLESKRKFLQENDLPEK